MITKEFSKGFTLVETILYATLAALLLGAIVEGGLTLSRSYQNVRTAKNIQTSALSAMDQMTRNIRQAESISGSGTTYNSAGGSLFLNTVDSFGNAHTVDFYLSGGKVMIDKDGVQIGPLTDARTSVTSLLFRHIDTGNSEGVKIEMVVGGKNFYDTVMLRGSYQ